MSDLSIRRIKNRVDEFARYQRHPKLTAIAEGGEYRLILTAVDDLGIDLEATVAQIVDARGKSKTVKLLDAVFAFAHRYRIDSNRVLVSGKL